MARIIERTYEETEERNRNMPWRMFTPLRSKKYTRKGEGEMAKVTIATYEETVERLKNEKYQVVSPLRYRRSISNSPKNKGGKHGKEARSILE